MRPAPRDARLRSPARAPAAAAGSAPARADLALGAVLALLTARLYRASAPAVVNLDGLGYVKLIPHNFAAGHLLYMPLLRALAALCGGDGLRAGRLLSAAAAGGAVALMFFCARSLISRAGALLAAAGLAVSYATWVQGADVEVYACALAALLGVFAVALAYRARPTGGRAAGLGLALAGAVLFHLTHVLLSPFVAVWVIAGARPGAERRRRLRHAALALFTGGAVSLAAYVWAAFHVRRLDLRGAVRWVATAGHGFPYRGSPLARLSDAVYGLAKAYVWSPYLYESNAQTLVAQLLLGLVPVAACAVAVVLGRRAVASLPWRSLCVWCAPYAGLALLFFGSDHERWLFVLPPLWLATAAALERLPPRSAARAGAALVAYLAVANAATAIGPARHESWARTQADAAAALLRPGDVVLFPGHSWDEYIGFYTRSRIVPFPIAYYAARDGNAAMIARLDREVAEARARGARVFCARLFDDASDERGFYELSALGLSRAALRALLAARFAAVPLATAEPKVTLWRLDDAPASHAPDAGAPRASDAPAPRASGAAAQEAPPPPR